MKLNAKKRLASVAGIPLHPFGLEHRAPSPPASDHSSLNSVTQILSPRSSCEGYSSGEEVHHVDGRQLFNIAVHGRVEEFDTLLTQGLTDQLIEASTWCDPDGTTLLIAASANGHVDIITKLLATFSLDPNQTDNRGTTPLYIASCNGHVEVVRNLLSGRADVDRPYPDGQTPLMAAAESHGIRGLIDILLEASADPSIVGPKGQIALHQAAKSPCCGVDVCRLLAGTDDSLLNSSDQEGITALMRAAESGSAEKIKCLIEWKADIHAVDTAGNTALHHAAREGKTSAVEALLACGADESRANRDSLKPLQVGRPCVRTTLFEHHLAVTAAVPRGVGAVREALELSDVDINAQDGDGTTALMEAVLQQEEEVVGCLIEAGADVTVVNRWNHPCILWARWVGHEALIQRIEAAGGGVTPEVTSGLAALEAAAIRSEVPGSKQFFTWSGSLFGKTSEGRRGRRVQQGATVQNRMEEGINDVTEPTVDWGGDGPLQPLEVFLGGLPDDQMPSTEVMDLTCSGKYFVANRIAGGSEVGWHYLFALYCYTYECCLYRKVNSALRSGKEELVAPWMTFIRHLNEALQAVPPTRSVVFRGITCPVDLSLYREGNVVTWGAFSSTSADRTVAVEFFTGSGVLFVADAGELRDIQAMSRYPEEKELLLPMNSQFTVVRVAPYNAGQLRAAKLIMDGRLTWGEATPDPNVKHDAIVVYMRSVGAS